MDGWKHESQFGDFIAESSTFFTAPPSPGPDHRPTQPGEEDMQAYQRTVEQVQKVDAHLKRNKDETPQVQHLLGFLRGARKVSPTFSVATQYERLQPLRTWLFWMPVGYLQKNQGSADSLVIIAHLYSVALLMERLFPEIGAAYFGSLAISPIEEIARRLMSISVAGANDGRAPEQTPLSLMEFPIDAVQEFRSRICWAHPERTVSFPQFDPPSFPEPKQPYAPPYVTTSLNYSAKQLPMPNGASLSAHDQAAMSPLPMPSPYLSQQFLGIPSPSYVAAYSPASSTFDNEYGPFGPAACPLGGPFMLSEAHRSYSVGFVNPHQPV